MSGVVTTHDGSHVIANCEKNGPRSDCFYEEGVPGKVYPAAKRHAELTGHSIDYEVHQFKTMRPATNQEPSPSE